MAGPCSVYNAFLFTCHGKKPNNLTFNLIVFSRNERHFPSNRYLSGSFAFVVNAKISTKSGLLTVAPQAKFSLKPTPIVGLLGKSPPIMFRPSSD